MKRIPILILFVFCLTTLFGGLFLSPNANFVFAADATGTTYYITSETGNVTRNSDGSFSIGLKEYVELYQSGADGNNHQNDNIVLQKDLNFKDAVLDDINRKTDLELSGTIGSLEKPFQGTFNGDGHTISNLKVKVDVAAKTSGNLGLFGWAENASFQNVQLDGTIALTANGGSSLDVGALVGRAENCTFKLIQLSPKIVLNTDFQKNLNFGGLVGSAENCDFSYIVSRSEFGGLQFAEKTINVHTIGGLVGSASLCNITFAVVQNTFSIDVLDTFGGTISFGGVVGNISEGGSKIINVAIENVYDFLQNRKMLAGQVAGQVCMPLPKEGNVSYIHFKEDPNISAFGNEQELGSQNYLDSNNICASAHSLSALQMQDGKCVYFTDGKNAWHPLLGAWDFDSVWYVIPPQIRLQSFSERFSLRVASQNTDSENAILLLKTPVRESGYKYGEEVTLQFEFKQGMEKFYLPSSLFLGGQEVAKISTKIEAGKTTYSLSGSENYEIKNTRGAADIENGFDLVIKSINMATAGNGSYSIGTTAKTFVGQISSKLFLENGEEDETVVPGFVYYVRENGEILSNTTERLTLNRISYGQNYRIGTRVKPGSPYAFDGWFMVLSDGSTKEIEGRILDVVFGGENFQSDFEVYAKYTMNACNITYIIDGGIAKIVVSDTIEVNESEQTVPVSKTDQSVKMEIFIEKGYVFETERFFDEIDTYLTSYTPLGVSEKDGYQCFAFVLDMTTMKDSSFSNAFTLTARTTKESSKNDALIWWIVGGVAGGALLIGLIVLIVVLVKRRGGGFGGMGGTSGKINKKAYKNMYY